MTDVPDPWTDQEFRLRALDFHRRLTQQRHGGQHLQENPLLDGINREFGLFNEDDAIATGIIAPVLQRNPVQLCTALPPRGPFDAVLLCLLLAARRLPFDAAAGSVEVDPR